MADPVTNPPARSSRANLRSPRPWPWRRVAQATAAFATLGVALVAGGATACNREVDAPALMRAELEPAPEVVHYVGRFDTSDPKGPRFAWSGSAVLARFTGPAISVRLRDEGYNNFAIVLDGRPSGTITTFPGRDAYSLGSGLGPGEHEVLLYKRTEARVGEVQFEGFVTSPDGQLVATSFRPTRRIELIGDSITAGYGDEGTSPTCTFRPSNENEYMAYGAITARNLHAEHVTIAWSGKTVQQMAELYDRTLPARTSSPWDPQRWVPDVIVINLGTNDFARGDPGESTFKRGYTSLLSHVRALHPRAFVVCALGPMLNDSYPAGAGNLTHARKYITEVVDAVRAHGDKRVVFVEFPTQDPLTAGCDYHPNLSTHRQMADLLTAVLRPQMRW